MNKKGVSKKNKSGRTHVNVIVVNYERKTSAVISKIARSYGITDVLVSLPYSTRINNRSKVSLNTVCAIINFSRNGYNYYFEQLGSGFHSLYCSSTTKVGSIIWNIYDNTIKYINGQYKEIDISTLDLDNMTKEKYFQYSTIVEDLDSIIEYYNASNDLVKSLKETDLPTLNTVFNAF